MRIFIVLLNWNRKEDTLSCLKTLFRLKNQDKKIIVVDNASTDGSQEKIKKEFPQVFLIENKENLGFAQGNNIGIDFALKNGADCILILNNDTLVEENLIERLLTVFEKDETIGIVSPKIYFAPSYEYHKKRYQKDERGKVIWYAGGIIDWQNILVLHRGVDEVDHGQYEKDEETDFATGCAMMVKKEVFERIGLFDNQYFLYFEDIDFCQRAKKKGFKILYTPHGIVWHKNARSSDGAGSSLHDYYTTRNRFLFAMRYASSRTKLAILRESLRLLFLGREWQKKGIIDFYLRRFGKGSFEFKNIL